jgi:aromatic-amino-acid transaminase
MIDRLTPTAPDPLLKIIKLYREDPRAEKIDLGVGVYRNASGLTPVMRAVKDAERRLLEQQTTKTYVGQQGDVEFLKLVGALALGDAANDCVAIQAVGGTGALRLGCDLLREAGVKRMILPAPSWPNHPSIITAARLERVDAPFFNPAEQRIDLNALLDALAHAAAGDAVLLQACCHNPVGTDFTLAQWVELAVIMAARGLIPFLDLAYQGFGDGLEDDVAGLRAVLERMPEAVIAVSEAKSFGVYRERVGALFVKAPNRARDAIASNLAAIARANYSMPPDHGASVVRTILSDDALRSSWRDELDGMRVHIKSARRKLASAQVDTLPMHLIESQKGMFSTLPLSEAQVIELRERHAVYMTDAARINVAGLREADIPRLVAALRTVA